MDETALRKLTRKHLAERDALFRNPTAKAALAAWTAAGWPPPVDSTVPLAVVHKARLQWLGATDMMLIESMLWLERHGYKTSTSGAPPLTPASRDAQRAKHGMPPLNSGE
jgi:hypothetical protein